MTIRCSIDRLDAALIEGWIVDLDAPQSRLSIDVVVGDPPEDRMIGQCTADGFRADLLAAGLGDGHCAFRFDIPSHSAVRADQFRLRLAGSDLFLRLPVTVPGSLWFDRADWLDHLAQRHRAGAISSPVSDLLCRFQRDGWVMLRPGVSRPLLQPWNSAAQHLWAAPPDGLMMESFEPDGHLRRGTPDPAHATGRAALIDPHDVSAPCGALLAAPRLTEMLHALLDGAPQIIRSRAGRLPAGWPCQQDAAVAPAPGDPLAMIGGYVFLHHGSQVQVITGSHRLPPFLFDGRRAMGSRTDLYYAYLRDIQQQASAQGLTAETVQAQPGDVLLHHAALAHGTGQDGATDGIRAKTAGSVITFQAGFAASVQAC